MENTNLDTIGICEGNRVVAFLDVKYNEYQDSVRILLQSPETYEGCTTLEDCHEKILDIIYMFAGRPVYKAVERFLSS